MKKHTFTLALALLLCLSLVSMTALAAVSDANNGDWSAKTVTLKNTSEAELMVRTGDIDALNDTDIAEDGYSPFTATYQQSHDYPWVLDASDPTGIDRIYVGSRWSGEAQDGYASDFTCYKDGDNQEYAFGDGAMTITMNYNISGISVKNALLQLCIDDFQALMWGSNFTVKLNGKDAPFVAELLNQVDQTGPTAYIVSAAIPSGFFSEISSGNLVITIDETTGIGDGYAVDFARLLVNYNEDLFTGEFSGTTEPGATVRLLGTSTTVTAANDGSFNFKAIPGLNAVRASKSGYKESYAFGIVLPYGTEWAPKVPLTAGTGNPDIDFSQFSSTEAWANASNWAKSELQKANDLGLIPDILKGADMTKTITREEFAELAVTLHEKVTGKKSEQVSPNPFTDTTNPQILKAYNLGITSGTSQTTFSPKVLINREQCATMLFRAIKAIHPQGDYSITGVKDFPDQKNISTWAIEATKYMDKMGIITGDAQGNFMPKATSPAQEAVGYGMATREQAIALSVRTYEVENLK